MKIFSSACTVACLSFMAALLMLQSGCEIDNGDETVRTVSLNIEGSYQNSSGIPSRQSGARVTTLNILQSGDQLTAIDNLGARWTGTIGRAADTVATITLHGLTSTGAEVVITGSITASGTTGSLTGLWLEPGISAPVNAQASIAAQPTATPATTVTPSATSTPGPGATARPGPTATPSITVTLSPTATPVLPPFPS